MIKNRFAQLYIRAIILAVMVIGAVLSFGAIEPAPNWYVYYTNLSNYLCLIIVFVELMFTIRKISKNNDELEDVNPALKFIALIGITVTFAVYNILLANPLKVEYWQDAKSVILHVATPLLFWFDWIFLAKHNNSKWFYPLLSLIFPLIYVAYILIRGVIISGTAAEWQVVYPYYFLDVTELGYLKVALWILALLAIFIVFGYIVYVLDNAKRFAEAYRYRKENPEAYEQAKAEAKAQKQAEKEAKRAEKEAQRQAAEQEENEQENAESSNVTNINIVIDGKKAKVVKQENVEEVQAPAEETAETTEEEELSEEEKQRLAEKEAKRAEKEARRAQKAEEKAALKAQRQAEKEARREAKAQKQAQRKAELETNETEETAKTSEEEELSEEEKQRLAEKQAKAEAKAQRQAEKQALKEAKKQAKAEAKAQKQAEKEARRAEKEAAKLAAEQAENETEVESSEEATVAEETKEPTAINIKTNGNDVNITIKNDDNK